VEVKNLYTFALPKKKLSNEKNISAIAAQKKEYSRFSQKNGIS